MVRISADADADADIRPITTSDQSVYDTDTEVPSLDEPLPSVQVQSDNVECVVSQECVVSEAPSTEAGLSDILYVTSGDRFKQLASSLLSKMSELQSDRGRHPPSTESFHCG